MTEKIISDNADKDNHNNYNNYNNRSNSINEDQNDDIAEEKDNNSNNNSRHYSGSSNHSIKIKSISDKSFSDSFRDCYRGRHIIILQHGFLGNSNDMKLLVHALTVLCPVKRTTVSTVYLFVNKTINIICFYY